MIGAGLAKAAVAAKVDGNLKDLSFKFETPQPRWPSSP